MFAYLNVRHNESPNRVVYRRTTTQKEPVFIDVMPPEVGLTRHRGAEATPEGDKCDGAPVPPAPAKERCPRCDSRDTKFCYYNNYNTSQPRHFCKSCRRYWTLGGSLRNVPIGGASRKRFRRSTTETVAGGRTGVASATPARVASRLSSPAPPRGYDPHHTQPLGLSEPSSLARTEYRLKLGLGLGCGSGLLPPVEEMEFGLAPTLLWPVGLGDTWPVGPDGGGCFAARPLAGSTAVSPVSAPAGVTGPTAAAAATGEFLRWSCE